MNEHFDQLVTYIKQHLDQGIPEDTIRQTLIQHHWNPDMVDAGFKAIQNPPADLQTLQAQHNADDNTLTQTQTPADDVTPKKYRVIRALSDTLGAIRNNALTVVLAVIISYLVAGLSIVVVSMVVGVLFFGHSGLTFASTSKLLTVLFGSLLLYTFLYAFAQSFILAATSLAINDGAEGRKGSIGSVISTSISRLGRVMVANLLFSLVVFWPMVFIIFIPLILLTGGHAGSNSSLILLPILVLISIIWVVIASILYSLAPYVALFEAEIPVSQSLSRSKHLLKKGGQWFLIKGFLLLMLFVIVISIATQKSLTDMRSSQSIIINLFFVVASVLIEGTLVMLYRNRKIVNG